MALKTALFSIALLLAVQVLALAWLGQPSMCECGYVKIWEGVVFSSGNSQHLSDWYTFSHIIHGIVFFFALSYFFPRLPITARFLLAVGIEVAWEVIENTPLVINHYRQQALAQGYTGDSIINSVSDTIAMIAGFALSMRMKTWHVVVMALVLEAFTLYMIRDSLALNIIGFVAPELFAGWQAQ